MNNKEKLAKVVCALHTETLIQEMNYSEKWKNEIERKCENVPKFLPFLTREQLRQLILGRLDYADRHAVYIMIDRLLGHGFIRNNPTSRLSAIQKKIMPTNDTRYFLNVEEIRATAQEIIKANYHTHTTTTLDTFNRKTTSSNGLSVSSEKNPFST